MWAADKLALVYSLANHYIMKNNEWFDKPVYYFSDCDICIFSIVIVILYCDYDIVYSVICVLEKEVVSRVYIDTFQEDIRGQWHNG